MRIIRAGEQPDFTDSITFGSDLHDATSVQVGLGGYGTGGSEPSTWVPPASSSWSVDGKTLSVTVEMGNGKLNSSGSTGLWAKVVTPSQTLIEPFPNHIYRFVSTGGTVPVPPPAGTVTSVNDIPPDGSGNVDLGTLGAVQSVDSVLPVSGNVPLGAERTVNKGQPSGYASLDNTGKLPSAQLPSLRIAKVTTVASQAAMLALPQDDDIQLALRSDAAGTPNPTVYALNAGADPSVLGNWQAFPVGQSLTGAELQVNKDAASGYAGLDAGGKLKTGEFPTVGTAGTYGDATHSLTITTDAQGRVTGVTANALNLAPLSNATPLIDGTASPGTATDASRSDHVHPAPSAAVVYPWRPFQVNEWRNALRQLNATQSVVQGNICLYPVPIPVDFTLDGLGCLVTNAGTAGTIRLLLYPDSNGFPGTCCADTGAMSLTTTGVKSAIGLNVTRTRGLYWCGYLGESITGTPFIERATTGANSGAEVPWLSMPAGSGSAPTPNTGNDGIAALATGKSGSQLGVAFAGSLTTDANTAQGVSIWFRFSAVTP